MDTDHRTALIRQLEKHGIKVCTDLIPEILTLGVDTFLERHGKELLAEDTTTLHLILFSIREEYERPKVFAGA
jgi:hypothetical protein